MIQHFKEKYGIDPYHLGVIFLLNLEVGYLHPPVGLNLFITSVKFQRPITEVMWATIPFLVTMLLALLTITYVPALTEVSANLSPYELASKLSYALWNTMPDAALAFGRIFPADSAIDGLVRINQLGASIWEVTHDWYVLWCLALAYFVLAVLSALAVKRGHGYAQS